MNEISNPGGVTIVGLGPGDPRLLTLQAQEWLQETSEIYLRTRQHPATAAIPATKIRSFDNYYENGDSFAEVYEKIVQKVIELGARPQGVTYAVPGHPLVAEATCPEVIRRAGKAGLKVQVIDGLSFLEPAFKVLGIEPFPRIALYDALELGAQHHPCFPPDFPVLIAQIYSREIAARVKLTLSTVYPDKYPVKMVHAAGTEQETVEEMDLHAIDCSQRFGDLSSLYIPPMDEKTSFEAFQELVAHLRAPDGCPWDREQTHQSLRPALLEETYEVISALDAADSEGLQEELGDLLLQIVLHSQIAMENGEFAMTDVLEGIHTKIVRRHPHVFGDVKLETSDRVIRHWEALKAEERKARRGKDGQKGLLDSVPAALPALAQAQSFQARAARVGFDWSEIDPVIEKVREEFQEVMSAADGIRREDELGDLLFAVVNLARWYRVDAESALRQTNERFRRRFAHIETRARQKGRSLHDMTLKEMDVFWDEAKGLEKDS